MMPAQKKPSAGAGRRVTRIDPPALEEAIEAAQGLTDDVDSQVEIAAQLMGMPEDEVRPAVLKASVTARPLGRPAPRFMTHDRHDGPKVVVVERKRPRMVMPR